MSDRIDEFHLHRDSAATRRLWVALALSVLIHIAAVVRLPQVPLPMPGVGEGTSDVRTPLTLRLLPPPAPPPPADAAPPRPPPKPAPRAARPKAAPRPKPPPVVAVEKPAPEAPPPVAVAPPVAAPQPAPIEGDLASYIEARRRARGVPPTPAPVEDEDARSKRIVERNLASERNLTFGYDPRRGGGMFQIQSIGVDHAEFYFYGWNKNMGRHTKQLIEVQRGNNPDIRLAMIRKMIAIIREDSPEDFIWESARLGRRLTLSARPRDNAGLETFMMNEFFYDAAPARR